MTKPTADQPAARPYESAAEQYWTAGWRGILPLPFGRKSPPPEGWTGWEGDEPSYADVMAWTEDRAHSNVGLRMPPDVLGIDVDSYGDKRGRLTLEECEAKWGGLPPTWRSTSRDDGISGIRFFRVPPGLEWPGVLPGGGVELVHRGHRYAVVAPSLHPEQRPYRWITREGLTSTTIPGPADMPPLPVEWIIGLSLGQHVAQARADLDNDQSWTWIGQLPNHNTAMCTFMAEWTARAVQAITTHGDSRHDTTRNQVLAVIRFGEQGHTGTSVALDRLRASFIRNVVGDNSRTLREASSEWGRIVTGAVRIVAGNPEITMTEGDPCPPVIATLRVPPRTQRVVDSTSPDLASTSPDPTGEVIAMLLAANTAPTTTQPRPTSPEVPGEVAEPDSWARADLQSLLQGDISEPPPEFLRLTNGLALFYPGRVNGIIGASESAKTWIMLEGVRQAVEAGIPVAYVDFEDGWRGITGRLVHLGLTREQIWSGIAYINPDRAFDAVAERMLAEMLGDFRPQLVVMDGVNACMTLNGWDLLSNKDATMFSQKILKPIARTGAAVSYVDHLPKADNDLAGAIGAQAKRAMTTGCAIKVKVERVFGEGQHGEVQLTVDKDRSGVVRGHCPPGTSVLGTAHLNSDPVTGHVTIRIEPATRIPVRGTDPALQPLMQAISEFLERMDGPVSGAAIERAVRGAATDTKRDAIDRLVIEGYIGQERVGRSIEHTSIRAYRIDPFSGRTTSPTSPDLASTSPGEVAGGSSRPPRLTSTSSRGERRGPGGLFDDLEGPDLASEAGQRTYDNVTIDDEGHLINADTGEVIDPTAEE